MDDYCASYKNIMLPKDKGKDMKTEALLHVSHVMWVCRPLCCVIQSSLFLPLLAWYVEPSQWSLKSEKYYVSLIKTEKITS